MNLDFLVIGGGPAGMAGAIQAARLGLSTAIVEKNELGGQALSAPWIENYPGFPNGISGKDLMHSFSLQVKKWSVPVISDEAIDIKKDANAFTVSSHSKNFTAKTILLALGLTPKLIGLKNEFPYANPERINCGNKNILIIGSGDAAFDLAWGFAYSAKTVTVGIQGDKPKVLPRLLERALARGVKIRTNYTPDDKGFDVVVSCIGKEARHPILDIVRREIGQFELKSGTIKNGVGIFLAGDLCRGHLRHISIACGDGIASAEMANKFLNRP